MISIPSLDHVVKICLYVFLLFHCFISLLIMILSKSPQISLFYNFVLKAGRLI